MKFTAASLVPGNCIVSFEPENEAERFQIQHFVEELQAKNVLYYVWRNEDAEGIGIHCCIKNP